MIKKILEEHKLLIDNFPIEDVKTISDLLIKTYQDEKKLVVFGNGGSAADSQHFVAELVGRFKKERRAFPAIALTTNTSIITALANDYNYDAVFERQVEALVNPGDVVIGISTSGKSRNVIKALRTALDKRAVVVLMSGKNDSINVNELDICLQVPSTDTARIQEMHILAIHIICEIVEEALA